MPIKCSANSLFICGFCLFMISLIPNTHIQLTCIFLTLLWMYCNHEYASILISVFIILLLVLEIVFYQQNPNQLTGRVNQVKESYFIVNAFNTSIMVYSDVQIGLDDIVSIEGSLEEIHSTNNRVGFNFSEWANSRNIRYSCSTNDIDIIRKGKSLRRVISEKLSNDEVGTIMRMFLFHIYDEDIAWLYTGLSLGMHISFFIRLLQTCLSYFFYEDDVCKISVCICLFICVFYYFDFVSVRILIIQILRLFKVSKKNAFGLYTIILMLLYPYRILDFSFILSVCIRLLYVFKEKKVPFAMDILFIWLQLIQNGYVNIIQVIVGKCIRPLFSLVYVICFINIWIPFEYPLVVFYKFLVYLSEIEMLKCNLLGKPYILFTLLFMHLLCNYVSLGKKKYIVGIVLLFLLNSLQLFYYPFARVVYIDVGQGDSTLVMLPFSKGNILIDTGGKITKDIASEIVYPVLSSYGVSSLDVVIISHDDIDHSGALDSLVNLIAIDEVIDEKNEVYIVGNLNIYDGLYDYIFEDGNKNSLTCCFSIYNSTFLMLGDIGVMQEEVLVNRYDNLQVDYLKVAHHGSSTSTSDALLANLQVDFAFISCGYNNRYNHPSSEVIKRLEGYKIPYLVTKECGAIEVVITPVMDLIFTENKEVFYKYKVPLR